MEMREPVLLIVYLRDVLSEEPLKVVGSELLYFFYLSFFQFFFCVNTEDCSFLVYGANIL